MSGRPGICKLCHKNANLHKRSHIIPQFMYQGMFNEHHKIIFSKVNDPTKFHYISTGIYESYIFCENCERKVLKSLEDYSSKVLYGHKKNFPNKPKTQHKIGPDGIKSLEVSNYDYKKLKLFFLSILYRIHLSNHKLFKKFSIDKEAEELRRLIVSNKIDDNSYVRISILALFLKENELARIIPTPLLIMDENMKIVFILINGLVYIFNFTKDYSNDFFQKVFMTEINLEIPFLNPHWTRIFLRKYFPEQTK